MEISSSVQAVLASGQQQGQAPAIDWFEVNPNLVSTSLGNRISTAQVNRESINWLPRGANEDALRLLICDITTNPDSENWAYTPVWVPISPRFWWLICLKRDRYRTISDREIIRNNDDLVPALRSVVATISSISQLVNIPVAVKNLIYNEANNPNLDMDFEFRQV